MKSGTIASIEIVTACFAIYFLYSGAARLVSVFFVESIHRYDINRQQASFPYVLAFIVANICGPVLGYLEQIFGIKFLIIFGNVLVTISIGACFFAEDILTITILWGVIFGFCFALGTQFLPLLLNAHFTKNRNGANGFAYSGTGLGGVVLPPIISTCIEYYGLNGTFLILAGIMAHLIPFSFLLKSTKEKSKSQIRNRKEKEKCIEMEADKKSVSSFINSSVNDVDEESAKNADITETNTTLAPTELDQNLVIKAFAPTEPMNQKPNENIKKKPASVFALRNFKVLLDPTFIIILIIIAGNSFVITTMWTIILDFVRDKGVGANLEIYYVMIMAVADIFGRGGSGFVIDKKFLPISVITSICFVCTGLTLLGLTFAYNYLLLMFIEFLLPLFYGSLVVLQIAFIHEFIQSEKKVMAMVCRTLLFAPLSFATSPMIGHFRGEHGSYDGVMYTLTGISFFCGFIIHFVPHLAKRRRTTTSNNVT